MKEKYYILSCSFGKDSLYLLNYLLDNNYPLNEVQFVEPMFSENISAILPEHLEFIDRVICQYSGRVRFNIIRSDISYSELYLKYGVPGYRISHWCTGWLKTKPLAKYNKLLRDSYEVYTYIGLCYNEEDRVLKNKDKHNLYPLYDNKILESTCYDYCKEHNLLSPIYYNKNVRDGCWFCPFQKKESLIHLRNNYPHLFNIMCDLESLRLNINSNYAYVKSVKPLKYYIDNIQTNIFDFISD